MVLTRSQTNRRDDEDRRQFLEEAAARTDPSEPAAPQRADSEEDRRRHARELLGITSPRSDRPEPDYDSPWRSELDKHLRRQAERERAKRERTGPPPAHRDERASGAIPKAARLAPRERAPKPPPIQPLPAPRPEAAMSRLPPAPASGAEAAYSHLLPAPASGAEAAYPLLLPAPASGAEAAFTHLPPAPVSGAEAATSRDPLTSPAPRPGAAMTRDPFASHVPQPGATMPRISPAPASGAEAATSRHISFAAQLEQYAGSERSVATSTTETRKRQAELRAAEKIAKLRWERLQLEEDLIQKKLAAEIAEIDEEGSRAGGSRAGRSVTSARKVSSWLEHKDSVSRQPQPPQPPRPEGTSGRQRTPEPELRRPQAADPPNEPEQRRQRQLTPPRRDATRQLHTPSPIPERRRERSRSPRDRDRSPDRTTERASHARTREDSSHREPASSHARASSRRRSGSGSEAIDRLADHISSMWRPPPRQVYELPTYSGETGEWLTFYNSYLESTRRYNFSNYENVSRLRQALKGEARSCVQHMLASTSNPDLILRVLKKNFGRTDLLVDRAIEDLKRLPPVGPSATDLNAFAIKVTNIVSTLVDLDSKNYGANPLLVREITERLSPHLRSRWCTYARENRTNYTSELSMMAEFLLVESDNEMEFSHARAPSKKTTATTASSNTSKRAEKTTSKGAERRALATYPPATYAVNASEPKSACLCCGGAHRTTECRRVTSMNVGARWEWARANRICFKCLNSKHRREHCRTKGCGEPGCPHSHHRLLHSPEPSPQQIEEPRRNESQPVKGSVVAHYSVETQRAPQNEPAHSDHEQSLATNFVGATVLLKVIPIVVSGPNGEVRTHALLDEGSTLSLIDEGLANVLGLVGRARPLLISGVGEMTTQQTSRNVTAKVRGVNGGPTHDISLRTVSKLGLRGQRAPREQITRYAHLSDMEAACYTEAVPHVLIGADHWFAMVPHEVRRGRQNEPVAVRNDLGWVIYGTVPSLVRAEPVNHYHCYQVTDDLNSLLKWHFSIEALGVTETTKTRPEDARAVEIMERTIARTPGQRYEVGQLWREDEFKTPPTYPMAFSRLKNIERKMDRDSAFAEKYTAQVQNLIDKGYAEEIPEPLQGPKQWFLPHFGAENINKPGKLRLVFDAAAQVQGRSLNDYILEGPDKLQSLPGILYRFRERAYAVTADIQEMFLRIRLRKEDQASQMFLWRGGDRERTPSTYVMSSIIFGAASSPFLAHSVRDRNARDNAEQYPDAVEDITTNHYMDDYVASYESEAECVRIAMQIDASHKLGGFELRSWNSNSPELLNEISPELRANQPTTMGDKNQKILGLMWDAKQDTLGYNTQMLRVPADVRDLKRGPTKRETLSAVMSIYDPLGLISHYTVSAKVQLQRLWALKMDWDKPLPDNERLEFQRWLQAMEHIKGLRLPRQYPEAKRETRYELHIFVDASAQTYAAAAYWRMTNHERTTVYLAAARAKVAPTKPTSIPRLELQAALIGARLQKSIKEGHRITPERTILWTDSKTVLQWVRDDARRYNVYVAHRLGEIADLTTSDQWRWVPTKENPADDATRADANRVIREQSRWYHGPEFLSQPEPMWPNEPASRRNERTSEHLELKKEFCNAVVHEDPPLPDIARFSSYDRLIRTTARMLQFIERLKKKLPVSLEVKHITGAEHLWMQHSQRKSFPEELRSLHKNEPITIKSRLYKLDPVLGEDGVLRMRGRLNAAPTPSLSKNPIILDGRDAFVQLLILRAHKRALHSNNEKVVNDLRQTYWILHLRPSVRAVARACRLCMLRRVQPRVPVFGDLPPARLQPYMRAFTYAAVDYMGPIIVTIGRRHEKRWVALFTCLTTRAVHLEVVHTLSTDSAIMALRRMGARRGYLCVMYSDNATCFRGADQELRAAYAEWLPALRDYGLREKMEWHFIPPGAPNQGGAWERLVRSVKVALSATLHTKAPKEEVLMTVLAEAENTINARPLTHVSVDPNDPEALTPAHFLLNGPAEVPHTGPCEEADRRAWRASQALADHFWSRWVREYLPTLAPRQSSAANERQIQEGDYVLIADPNLPRNVWPRGIVVTTHPGPDGAVRSADVRTRGGVFRRPTRKLAVLPLQPEVVAELRRGGECQRQPVL